MREADRATGCLYVEVLVFADKGDVCDAGLVISPHASPSETGLVSLSHTYTHTHSYIMCERSSNMQTRDVIRGDQLVWVS